jgi:adenylate kinase family enzyme
MPERILVMGNSGSGKRTLARALAARHGLARLDLDDLVWEPGGGVVRRPTTAIVDDLDAFVAAHAAWVIEGCYGELIAHASSHCSELIFLNPGRRACRRNTDRRSWEAHASPSAEEQAQMLPQLRAWVESYYDRDDAWSYAFHRRLFLTFSGQKRELGSLPPL